MLQDNQNQFPLKVRFKYIILELAYQEQLSFQD